MAIDAELLRQRVATAPVKQSVLVKNKNIEKDYRELIEIINRLFDFEDKMEESLIYTVDYQYAYADLRKIMGRKEE